MSPYPFALWLPTPGSASVPGVGTGVGFGVDILDSGFVKQGAGPLLTASRATLQRKLDQSGTFSIEAAGTDPSTADVIEKRIAQIGGLLGTPAARLYTTFGSGTIDKIDRRVPMETGAVNFVFSGSDLLGELANTSVLNTPLNNGAGGPTTIAAALTAIMAFVPAWTIDTTTYTDSATKPDAIYLTFAGESVLTALNKIATATGRHFRLGTLRQVVWLWDAQPSSGVRVISAGDGATLIDNDEVALIQSSLDITSDTHDIVTRVYPFGGGNASARITLNNATSAAPAGYTMVIDAEPQKSYIEHDAAVALYGVIERQVSFKDASAAGTATAITETHSTGNQILAQAVEYLRLHSAPLVTYSFRLVKLDQAVYPGETVDLVFRRTVDGYRAVDEDVTLIVLDSTLEFRTEGDPRTVAMTVATTDRRPASDVGAMVGMMAAQQSTDNHSYLVPRALVADTATVANAAALPWTVSSTDAGTGNRLALLTLTHKSTATPAASFGDSVQLKAETDTHVIETQMQINSQWVVATNGSQTARGSLFVYDTAIRECIRLQASGSAAMLSFYGVAAVARPTAYTQTYSTAARTIPAYTTDAESAAYTAAADGEAKLVDLNNLRVAYENLRTQFDALLQVTNSIIDDLQAVGLLQ